MSNRIRPTDHDLVAAHAARHDVHVQPDPVATILVRGTPMPAGSKRAFRNQYTGRIQMVESSKKAPAWRDNVRTTAVAEIDGTPGLPLDEPLAVAMVFTMPKPASAPKSRRSWADRRPDVVKLARSTEDALTDAGLWVDDARIVEYLRLAKVYPGEDPDALSVPGVIVRVWRLTDIVLWGTPQQPEPAPQEQATLPIPL